MLLHKFTLSKMLFLKNVMKSFEYAKGINWFSTVGTTKLKICCNQPCINIFIQRSVFRCTFSAALSRFDHPLLKFQHNAHMQMFHKSVSIPVRNLSNIDELTSEVPSFYDRYIFPEPPDVITEDEHDTVVKKVNECIADPNRGRLFAIIMVANKQFKVTDHDLIKTPGFMVGVEVGDRIRMERVALVGGRKFTIAGRPLLRRSLVKVEATVIEQTSNADKVIQYFQRRKSFQRRYIYTPISTVLRINSVQAFPVL